MFNLFTREQLPPVYFSKQYLNGSTFDYSEHINSAKMDLPDECLRNFHPVLMFEAREQKKNFSEEIELYYIEHFYTIFKSPNGNLCLLRYDQRAKKYWFTPHYGYYREAQNIRHYVRERARKDAGIVEPNKIGKFTEKKVSEWLEYCDREIEFLNSLVSDVQDKNKTIERQIADFAIASGGDVSQWHNNTEVKTKNFTVIFTHDKASQYLTTKIEFNGGLNDVLRLLGKEPVS